MIKKMTLVFLVSFLLMFLTVSGICQSDNDGQSKFSCEIKDKEIQYLDLLLRSAISAGDIACVKTVLALGVSPVGELSHWKNSSPIVMAANLNHPSIIKLLIKAGESIKSKDAETALYLASGKGYFFVVKELIDVGVSPDSSGPKKITASMIAAAAGHQEILSLLLSKGADINSKSEDNQTALMVAADIAKVINLLVQQGANLEALDTNSRTALFLAVSNVQIEKLKELIRLGARINVFDKDGMTPKLLANKIDDKDTRLMILSLLNK